jgi:signal peptidase I
VKRGGHLALTVRSLLEILVLALFVSTFIIQPSHIPSASMSPTLRPGDMLLDNNQAFAPEGLFAPLLPPTTIHRGDIAIFRSPTADADTDLVKRIIGLPGDHLHLHNGHVLLNGHPLAEPYAVYTPTSANTFRDDFPSLHSVDPDVDPAWWTTMRQNVHDGELTIPPDNYFVLGDNRNNSEDSRYWGFVPRTQLVGKPLLVYLPKIRIVR